MSTETKTNYSVLDGTDLILDLDGAALGYSTGCKVSTTVETGERVTKEAASGKWKEKFVKTFSEEISAEGLALRNSDATVPAYDELKAAMLAGKPVKAHYSLREGSGRTGKAAGGYSGNFIITSLELDGQAGDDAKYSVKLENTGAVTLVTNGSGLKETASVSA